MQIHSFADSLCKSLIGIVVSGVVAGSGLAQAADVSVLFDSFRKEGRNAEQVITGLQESGVELKDATVFSVVNAGSIGLSVAYAQTGVCLAPDEANAQIVGQQAVDSAPENARKAVQASVVSALSSYVEGSCQQLLDQINNASQAFAAPTGSSDGAASPGGGAAPEIDVEEPPASESE